MSGSYSSSNSYQQPHNNYHPGMGPAGNAAGGGNHRFQQFVSRNAGGGNPMQCPPPNMSGGQIRHQPPPQQQQNPGQPQQPSHMYGGVQMQQQVYTLPPSNYYNFPIPNSALQFYQGGGPRAPGPASFQSPAPQQAGYTSLIMTTNHHHPPTTGQPSQVVMQGMPFDHRYLPQNMPNAQQQHIAAGQPMPPMSAAYPQSHGSIPHNIPSHIQLPPPQGGKPMGGAGPPFQPPGAAAVSLGSMPPPPPASTSPQNIQQPHQQQIQSSLPPPSATQKRARRGISIIDPTTGKSIFDKQDGPAGGPGTVSDANNSSDQSSQVTVSEPDSQQQQSTAQQPPAKKNNDVSLEFAAKVASLAAEPNNKSRINNNASLQNNNNNNNDVNKTYAGNNNNNNNAGVRMSAMGPTLVEPTTIASRTDRGEALTSDARMSREDQLPPNVAIANVSASIASNEMTGVGERGGSSPPEAAPQNQEKEMLNVMTDHVKSGDDSLYEPVSPTPLPDSPMDEARNAAAAAAAAAAAGPPPTVTTVPTSQPPPMVATSAVNSIVDNDGFQEMKTRKKKMSSASKKAELNRKGLEKEQQNSNLYDVFTTPPPQDTAANKSASATPSDKEPSPQPVKPAERDTTPRPLLSPEPMGPPQQQQQAPPPSMAANRGRKSRTPLLETPPGVGSSGAYADAGAAASLGGIPPPSQMPPPPFSTAPADQSASAANHVTARAEQPPPPQPVINSGAAVMNGILESIPKELLRGALGSDDRKSAPRQDDSDRKSGADKVEAEDSSENKNGEAGGSGEVAGAAGGIVIGLAGEPRKMKLPYKEDQWSPSNPDGRKQYDREFLICLQCDPLSLQKPDGLPELEIVKDQPNTNKVPTRGGSGAGDFGLPGASGSNAVRSSNSSWNIMPNYVSSSNSRQGVSKRPSKSKEPPNRPPVRVISLPSFTQDVQLKKAKHAWKPGVMGMKKGATHANNGTGSLNEDSELDDICKKTRSILNKLTPQKFDVLINQFKELPIDTEAKLVVAIDQIFEKAIDEPAFSVAYARMCQILSTMSVKETEKKEKKEFRRLLVTRCQNEFNREYMDAKDKLKYEEQMADSSLSEAEKKKIKEEYQAKEMKARRRSLGNIRFIGELYKLSMLTCGIMHQCFMKLLEDKDEESLECLCRLGSTVGEVLEYETDEAIATWQKKNDEKGARPPFRPIGHYFKQIENIIEGRKTSSRVRFLLQDLVDLKRNKWKKRREEAGPKLICQIHEEVKKEQLISAMAASAPGPPLPPPQSSNTMGRRDDPRKRSVKGGGGGYMSQSGGGSESGWQQAPTKAAKNFEKLDHNKIKNLQNRHLDVETLHLGPTKGNWSRGSGANNSSTPSITNRFQAFSSSIGSGNDMDGYDSLKRSSSSNSGFKTPSGGGRPGLFPSSMGSRGGERDPPFPVGRNSRGPSTENDRAGALAAAKEFVSKGGGGRTRESSSSSRKSSVSRESSMSRNDAGGQRLASGVDPEYSKRFFASAPSPSMSNDPDVLKRVTNTLLDEFTRNGDWSDTVMNLMTKFHTSNVHLFVRFVVDIALEKRSENDRRSAGKLLGGLKTRGVLRESQYLEGIRPTLEIASELIVDIPKFWIFFANIAAPWFYPEGGLPFVFVNSFVECLKGDCGEDDAYSDDEFMERMVRSMTSKMLASLLHEISAVAGESRAADLWNRSGLKWADFVPTDLPEAEYIRDNKLDFVINNNGGSRSPASGAATASGGSAPSVIDAFDREKFRKRLTEILGRHDMPGGAIIDKTLAYIDGMLGPEGWDNPDFIRTLVMCVTESALDNLGGSCTQINLRETEFQEKCSKILKKYIDTKPNRSIQALFSLQQLMVKLNHPTKLLHKVAVHLYDSDVIDEDGFFAWKENTDAAEFEGKHLALESLYQFFVKLAEQDDD